ncbi:hypothetical protein VTI74DRAFT_9958 [Chaetomium olivicolor]
MHTPHPAQTLQIQQTVFPAPVTQNALTLPPSRPTAGPQVRPPSPVPICNIRAVRRVPHPGPPGSAEASFPIFASLLPGRLPQGSILNFAALGRIRRYDGPIACGSSPRLTTFHPFSRRAALGDHHRCNSLGYACISRASFTAESLPSLKGKRLGLHARQTG